MSNIGDNERKTQNRVIDFFKNTLHYTYIGNLSEQENSNIIEDKLSEYLKGRGYSRRLINGAIDELKKASLNLQQGLYSANKEVYSLLKYGAKVKEDADKPAKTVYFIDFEDIGNNDFYIAEEVTVVGNNTKRPDLVIYVNGIALAVIELKNSRVSVNDGIRQNNTNQNEGAIRKFFTTMQFCVAGNESEGMRYGTVGTAEKFYLEWKEDAFTSFSEERNETDLLIEEKIKDIKGRLYKDFFCLFYKKRFLDLIHNFVIFDNGRKKLCRYNQYYAIKRAQMRILNKNQGGIVWHTQGSGKSLTMVWLSKWILSNIPDARVLIITDREELDDQIERLYTGVDVNISRAKSGKDLLGRINAFDDRMMCSLIHKFGKRGTETKDIDYDAYIKEIKESLPEDFSPKGRFFIFVDECHRTQSGKLHKAMKAILPDGIFVGFTGTPLLVKDKETSLEIFGGYIHTYKFDEAVRDGVVLDLRYEAREVEQDLTSEEKIEEWFELKTSGLTDVAKAKLKKKWGNMQKMFSSRSRLEKIANDIIVDFEKVTRLADGRGNAILVADSVYSACKYYEIFQSKGFRKCAIISSYTPNFGDLRTETVSDDEDTEIFTKYEIYNKMLGDQTVEAFETEAKRKFINEPNNMKLLIVVDKLLTGFDAPPCTYLYIDKSMHNHGLFQAICRVNRLDDKSAKDFGYIVDYMELFGDLADAINTYTSGAFEEYAKEDIEGLLKDRKDEARKHFGDILEQLEELCEGVSEPKDDEDYYRYFCGDTISDNEENAFVKAREKLYKLANSLLRAFGEFKPYIKDFEYTAESVEKIEEKVVFYVELSNQVARKSGDAIDLKQYEPGMRFLIDNYINAKDAEKLSVLEEFSLLDFILSKEESFAGGSSKANESIAETIENNIRRKVVEKTVMNPAYYAKMSEILKNLVEERKKSTISYKQLLEKYVELARNVEFPQDNTRYPASVRESAAMRTLYDNCGEDEGLAIRLHNAVLTSKLEGFRNNPVKEKKIKKAILGVINNPEEVERIYKLIVEQEEY